MTHTQTWFGIEGGVMEQEWITWELAQDKFHLYPSDFNPSCVDWDNFMVRIK